MIINHGKNKKQNFIAVNLKRFIKKYLQKFQIGFRQNIPKTKMCLTKKYLPWLTKLNLKILLNLPLIVQMKIARLRFILYLIFIAIAMK